MMNKQEILSEYKNCEERLMIAKVLDKLEFSKTKNRIQSTDFLNLIEQEILLKLMKKIRYHDFYFYGGNENSERKMLVFYPDKLTEDMAQNNNDKLISVIRIKLPKEIRNEYNHRNYLGAIIKLGIEREKIGDIIVGNLETDIVVKNEIVKYLLQNLNSLTRFKSADIYCVEIENLKELIVNKKEISVIVTSPRLDNIVSVLARTSRNKAKDIIEQERVFINYKPEIKSSKNANVGDIITIRGKGKFEFKEIVKKTKNNRCVVKFEQYI